MQISEVVKCMKLISCMPHALATESGNSTCTCVASYLSLGKIWQIYSYVATIYVFWVLASWHSWYDIVYIYGGFLYPFNYNKKWWLALLHVLKRYLCTPSLLSHNNIPPQFTKVGSYLAIATCPTLVGKIFQSLNHRLWKDYSCMWLIRS